MKVKGLVFVYLFLIIVSSIVLFVSCETQQEKTEMTEQQMLERGKLLTAVGDCDACHTPKNFGPNGPELDMTRRFSGRPAGMELAPVDTSLLHNWAYLSKWISVKWIFIASCRLLRALSRGVPSAIQLAML